MSHSTTPLILFTKIPGRAPCKTRLRDSSGLNDKEVISLATAFLADVLLAIENSTHTNVVLSSDPAISSIELRLLFDTQASAPSASFLSSISLCPQSPLPFDQRLSIALSESANESGAVILGSDSPIISPDCIKTALEEVGKGNAVLGPAPHGGIYLLGIPSAAMSSGFTLKGAFDSEDKTELETLTERLLASGCAPRILPVLFDIDVEEDLISVVALVSALNASGNKSIAVNTHAVISELGIGMKRSPENNREPKLLRKARSR